VITTYKAAPDIDVLTSSFPVPGFGLVPINAFVLHGREPVLVDTGAVIERDEFMTALRTIVDPTDLKWIWLTHTDFDHVGALPQLLVENHELRVITTFLGVGILRLSTPLPMDCVHLLNPGQPCPWATARSSLSSHLPSTTPRQPASTTASPGPSSARTVSERSSRDYPTTQVTFPTKSCGKVRSSERRSTRHGCTMSTAVRSPRSWTASATLSPPWS
jgi:hypothetical protein